MKQPIIVLALVIVGLLSLALGFTWNQLVPSAAYWGEVEAHEYEQAQLELHEKSHHHDHGGKPDADFAAAQERFSKINREFERAQFSRRFAGTFLITAGIALLTAGVGVYLTTRQTA